MPAETTSTVRIGDDEYRVRRVFAEELASLDHWVQLDGYGRWSAHDGSFSGEWLSHSPSLFFREKIVGDYLWQTTVTRLRPDQAFVQRFLASKWGKGKDPLSMYNFNFWLRARAPDGGDFLQQYPTKLGTGWNGMGDDYWHSLYTTVVRSEEHNWVRLRRSPGYVKVRDVADVVPFLPYDEPHRVTFVLRSGHVKMYFDDKLVYDHEDPAPYPSGHIGLCVWLCIVRFEDMVLYRF